MNFKGLNRDFWLYRGGQAVSIIGDSCGMIAMSWWILEATGSAAKMGSILAPAMFVRLVLMPILAPLGDRFSRKFLIVFGDIWRGLFYCALALMVHVGYFDLWAVMGIYTVLGIGSAVFSSGATAIVVNLVRKEQMQLAMQQTQAINSAGQILGGAIGGGLVTLVGIKGALLLNAASFFIAAGASWLIKSETQPATDGAGISLKIWAMEFSEGLRTMVRIPTLLWLGIFAAFLNFAFSPLSVGLPVLVKEMRGMPPWFLGALMSSVSCGTIIGSFTVGYFTSRWRTDMVMVFSTVLLGAAFMALPYAPTVMLPPFVMFCLGFVVALINIPLDTKLMVAMPDRYRARLGGTLGFLAGAMSPLGVMLTGFCISGLGLPNTFLAGGLMIMIVAPMLFWVPGFSALLRLKPEEAHDYFARSNPEAFP